MESTSHRAAAATPLGRAASQQRVNRVFRRYRDFGDEEARAELIERFLPLARSVARRFQHTQEPLEDLSQVASVALIKAIDSFDPDRGAAFSSYAVPTMLGELKRYFRDSCWDVHVPRGVQERAIAASQAVTRLSADTGRSPAPDQIASDIGCSVEQALEALEAARAYDTMSLDAPAREENGDGQAFVDIVGESDARYLVAEYRTDITVAMRVLPPLQKEIVRLRFVEDLTQSEIGRRVGISQMHVSRLLRRALARLAIVVGERRPSAQLPA